MIASWRRGGTETLLCPASPSTTGLSDRQVDALAVGAQTDTSLRCRERPRDSATDEIRPEQSLDPTVRR